MKGVLFDVDGTLVDSNYLHAVTWHEALRTAEHVIPMATLHHCIGMGSEEMLGYLLGDDRDRSADDSIIDAHKVLYRQWWRRLTLLPGARELLASCHGRGLTVVLASSAHGEELDVLVQTLRADEFIDTATSGDDAQKAKPAPDLLGVALDRADLEAHEALFVGDSVWDGHAAAHAGLAFIAVTCGGTAEEALRDAGAIEVWRDPADLLANSSAIAG